MKKIFTKAICLLIILSCWSLPVIAADSITVGDVTEADKAVTVNFTVANLQADDEVTILVYKKDSDDSEPDENNIVYINQVTPQNNKISFNLLTTAAEGLYEVRMGGTGIETASVGQFAVSSLIYGDLNGDKEIDIADAVWILRYLSGTEMADYVTIQNGNINSDDVVDIADAVWILRYLSGSELPDYVKLPKE